MIHAQVRATGPLSLAYAKKARRLNPARGKRAMSDCDGDSAEVDRLKAQLAEEEELMNAVQLPMWILGGTFFANEGLEAFGGEVGRRGCRRV